MTKHCIFITGVAQRLGLALTHHFLEKNWHVIGCYRTEREALEPLRQKGATLIQCDFQSEVSVDTLLHKVKHHAPSLRAIIHNASDWLAEGKANANADVFDRMFNVHTKAPYLLNLGLKDALTHNESLSDIIHISDYVAHTGSKKHLAYAASKAALESLSLSFAAAFAPEIKVNSIAPALLKFNDSDDEAYKTKALNKAALPWEGSFEEAINAVNYLLDSEYITGRTIHLDGGRHLK